LFEGLVEGHLVEKGFTVDGFYTQLESMRKDEGEVGEILDVVVYVADFDKWAKDMHERAIHKRLNGY